MSYDTATLASRPLLLCGVCGALVLFMAGVWGMAPATINAHVQTQRPIGLQALATPHLRLSRGGPLPLAQAEEARTMALSAVPVAAAAPAVGLASPWLSLAAILISVVAIVINLVRRPDAIAYPALSAPVTTAARDAMIDETIARQRSNRIDEIALATKAEQASRKFISPKQVILELQRGNARFWSGTPERPELNAMERRALIISQAPTVAILSCSDSRVPTEIVFDQGLGSVFVVRVAGNILDATAIGSLEFAVKYLGVKVVLVMGHEGCGAVKGAVSMSPADLEAQPAYLQSVLRTIKGNLNVPQLTKIRDSRAQDREAIIINTSTQVKKLQENKLMASKVADGSLMVVGAFYEITSGIVDFFSLDKNGLVADL